MSEIKGYKFPEELYYHAEHAWARLEEDGTILVGITDFAQQSAGEIAYIDMPMEGDEIEFGGTAAKIQTAKWVGKLLSPVSGEVTEVNEDVADNPEEINEHPYEAWAFKVQPSAWEEESAKLMRAGTPDMLAWLDKEIARVQKEMEESGH